jgi:hypothetical protein
MNSEKEVPMKLKAPKKVHQKPMTIAREGHSLDRFFPTISLIRLRVHILDNQEWAGDFAQVLVRSERRDGVPRVVAPNISDRAHDSFKGMMIYWKMTRCSFRLPLSKFVKDLGHHPNSVDEHLVVCDNQLQDHISLVSGGSRHGLAYSFHLRPLLQPCHSQL